MAVLLVIFACQIPSALATQQAYAQDEIKIGVLAYRGNPAALIPESITFDDSPHSHINVLTPPFIYIELCLS